MPITGKTTPYESLPPTAFEGRGHYLFDGKLVRLDLLYGPKMEIPGGRIWVKAQDERGNLWALSRDGYVYLNYFVVPPTVGRNDPATIIHETEKCKNARYFCIESQRHTYAKWGWNTARYQHLKPDSQIPVLLSPDPTGLGLLHATDLTVPFLIVPTTDRWVDWYDLAGAGNPTDDGRDWVQNVRIPLNAETAALVQKAYNTPLRNYWSGTTDGHPPCFYARANRWTRLAWLTGTNWVPPPKVALDVANWGMAIANFAIQVFTTVMSGNFNALTGIITNAGNTVGGLVDKDKSIAHVTSPTVQRKPAPTKPPPVQPTTTTTTGGGLGLGAALLLLLLALAVRK